MIDEQGEAYGKEATERAQNYRPMPMANPDPPAEPALTDEQLAHFNRPAPPPPVERVYTDQATGEPRPDNEVLPSPERAAQDLSEIRESERWALEQQSNADLTSALDHLQGVEPRAEQPQEPQPALTPEAFAALDVDQQNAFVEAHQARTQEAERQLQAVLADPIIREKIESEFSAVRTQAAQQVEEARGAFRNATAGLANEAAGLVGALYPELAGLNGPQIQGALQVMAKTQPERVQQLAQLVARSQNIIAANQQQQAQEQTRQQQQHAAALQQYADQQVKIYEAAIARDRSPEQIRALRDNVMPMVSKHYGITEADMRALYSGQSRIDAATMMRSSAFQLMLSDALSYRMGREAVGRAAHREVPHVIRPGSSADAISRKDAALSEAASKLKPSMSAKEAANYLIARRGANR